MAEKILKGINFPGLEDTYVVDNYVKTINGNAPDAEGNVEIEIGSGGSIAAVQSDWNQNDETNAAFIKNRPFYDSEIEVFNQELTFINGENTWHLNVVLEDLSDNTLVEGKNYTVIWDNTSYNCECYVLEDVPCLGNAGNAGHENLENGLPFFIARYNTEAMKVWAITLPEKDPSLNPESTIIHCKIKSDDVHKIDPKYIYQSDWNAIDENDAAYIKNKPFGETADGVKHLDNKYLDFIETSNSGNEIIPEQEISLFVNDNGDGTYSYTGGYLNYNGENIGTKDESFYNEMLKLQVGKEYIITYNGKEYKYSAIDVREEAEENGITASIAIALGNPTGALTEEHPIGVSVVDMVIGTGVYYTKMATLNVLASENSEPIISTFSIREASSSKIKKEYLPDDIGGSVNPDTLKFKSIILESSTEGSSKCFKITIDDTGTLSVEALGG